MRAPIIERRELSAGRAWLRLGAPELASAQPGQFVMAAGTAPRGDPFLRRRLFLAGADPRNGTVALIGARQELEALDAHGPGALLDLLGPLGRPITLPAQARQIVLIAGGWAAEPLLFLAQRLAGRSVLFLHLQGSDATPIPAYLLPPEVEYLSSAEPVEMLLSRPLQRGASSAALWGEFFVAGGAELAPGLAEALRIRPTRWARGLAMLVHDQPLPCGLGLCGACLLSLRQPMHERLVCLDGPTFDLKEL